MVKKNDKSTDKGTDILNENIVDSSSDVDMATPLNQSKSGGRSRPSLGGSLELSNVDLIQNKRITEVSDKTAILENRVDTLQSALVNYVTLGEYSDDFDNAAQKVLDLQKQLNAHKLSLEQVAKDAKVDHILITTKLAESSAQLVKFTKELVDTEFDKPVGQAAISKKKQDIERLKKQIAETSEVILKLNIEQNQGRSDEGLLEDQIIAVRKQLRATIRPVQAKIAKLPWSVSDLWSTHTQARTVSSLKSLIKNPAFSDESIEAQDNDALKIHVNVLKVMNMALYAASNFHEYQGPVEAEPTSVSTSAANTSPMIQPTKPPKKVESDSDIVSRQVLTYVLDELKKIRAETGGLIGSNNPSLQFWGKVLMILAVAIGLMLAAGVMMSVLGLATPAFLVPVFAAIKANSIVVAVLNLVAAKLTLDLTTAAVVTTAATAGVFGMFGKGLHYAGSETRLKHDLDATAQALEADICNTPAMRAK